MLIHHDARHDDSDRLTALFEVDADILGARRRPLPLALASVVSALLVLATCPLTSIVVFATIAFFLVFAVYLVLIADAELARRGAHQFAVGGSEVSSA